MLCFPSQHQFHGFASNTCQLNGCASFYTGSEFASKSATHVLCNDSNLVRRQFKVLREIVANPKNTLCRCPNGKILIIFPFCDVPVCFQTNVRLNRCMIGCLDINSGFSKSCIDIAVFPDIRFTLIARPILSDLRCVRRHRVRFCDDVRQFLQVNMNEADRVLSDVICFSGNSSNFLPLVPEFITNFNERNNSLDPG